MPRYLMVMTTPAPFWGMTSSTDDRAVQTFSSYDRLRTEVRSRWDKSQSVGVLGATEGLWCATFTNGARARRRNSSGQTLVKRSTYQGLLTFQFNDKSAKNKMITQLAARDGSMVALFEPMLSGERCRIRTHQGRLTPQIYKTFLSGNEFGLVTAAYFEPEDRWIFVMSSAAVRAERWTVPSSYDSSYVKDGYDKGYRIRVIVTSPSQWFILMQKDRNLSTVGQSLRTIDSWPHAWINRQWKDGKVVTCMTGVPK